MTEETLIQPQETTGVDAQAPAVSEQPKEQEATPISEQDINRLTHENKSLYNRLAPTQRKLAATELQLEKAQKEIEELRKSFTESQDATRPMVASTQAEKEMAEMFSADVLAEMDPIQKQVLKTALIAKHEAINAQKPSFTTQKSEVSDDEIQSRMLAYRVKTNADLVAEESSNPDTHFGKLSSYTQDPDFMDWYRSNTNLQSKFAELKDYVDKGEEMVRVQRLISSIDKDIGKYKTSGTTVTPQTSIGGIAGFVNRNAASTEETSAQLARKADELYLKASQISRSSKAADRNQARDLIKQADEIMSKLRQGN